MSEEITSGIEGFHIKARRAKPTAEGAQQGDVVIHQKNDGLFPGADGGL